MWILAYVPAIFGVLRHRRWSYWRWVVVIFLAVCAGEFLFSGHGTPSHPQYDGLVVQALKRATGDGLEVALVGIVFLVVFWGGVIYCGRRIYREGQRPAEELPPAKPVGRLRKAVELILLTALFGVLVFLGARAASERNAAMAADVALEENLDLTVATVNAETPKKLDEITVLTRASREGRTLVIDHEITDKAFTRAQVAAYLRDQKSAELCNSADQRRLLDDGGALRYRYVLAGEAGTPVVLDLSSEDCKRR